LRQLNRSRGFAVNRSRVAILTLALGIGANTAIFSVIDSILLEPLPFPHQDRLVQVIADPGASNSPRVGSGSIRPVRMPWPASPVIR
jgi:hypothetical protein